jgi:hypothetical protein
MMALMSGALETCVRVLGTCIPSWTGRSARIFFMLEAYRTCGSTGAYLSRKVRSGAIGHVAALEPTSVRK